MALPLVGIARRAERFTLFSRRSPESLVGHLWRPTDSISFDLGQDDQQNTEGSGSRVVDTNGTSATRVSTFRAAGLGTRVSVGTYLGGILLIHVTYLPFPCLVLFHFRGGRSSGRYTTLPVRSMVLKTIPSLCSKYVCLYLTCSALYYYNYTKYRDISLLTAYISVGVLIVPQRWSLGLVNQAPPVGVPRISPTARSLFLVPLPLSRFLLPFLFLELVILLQLRTQ